MSCRAILRQVLMVGLVGLPLVTPGRAADPPVHIVLVGDSTVTDSAAGVRHLPSGSLAPRALYQHVAGRPKLEELPGRRPLEEGPGVASHVRADPVWPQRHAG